MPRHIKMTMQECVFMRKNHLSLSMTHISLYGLLRWLRQKHLSNQNANAWIKNHPVWITHPTHTAKLLTHIHTDSLMRRNQHTSHLRSAHWNRTSKLWKWWHLDKFRDSVKYHLNSKMLHSDCRTELKSKNISVLFCWNSLRRSYWTDLPNIWVFPWLDESHENMSWKLCHNAKTLKI